MDPAQMLRETIAGLPLPGAPPRLSFDGAAVALSFLDTTLRLNHVRRLTERLSVVEHRAATRATEVDISTSMLDKSQLEASALLHDLRTSARAPGRPAVRSQDIWVPVTRISKRSVAPVDVFDAGGGKLPRLTQHETSQLLASGLYYLLRNVLQDHLNLDPSGRSPVRKLLHEAHEARWLLQWGLVTLLGERTRPAAGPTFPELEGHQIVDGHGAKQKRIAGDVLDRLHGDLGDFFALLDLAMRDYLLVVALPVERDEHILHYDAPLHVAKKASLHKRIERASTGRRRGYIGEYSCLISPNVRSYHLVVETQPGVEIDRLILTTDADREETQRLQSDLLHVGERYDEHLRAPSDKASYKHLELQLQTVLRDLSELVRRRSWDADHAHVPFRSRSGSLVTLAAIATAGKARVRSEATGASNSAIEQMKALDLSAEALREAAADVDDLELYRDLSLENDPAASKAHAYWRRRGTQGKVAGDIQVRVRASFLLVDSTAAGRSVSGYAASVAGMILVTYLFLVGLHPPFSTAAALRLGDIRNADAVVAGLLLVPGFLYSRLSLPERSSVLGRLQSLTSLIAKLCVGSVAILAAAVAAGTDGLVLNVLFVVATVLASAGSIVLLARQSERTATPSHELLNPPRWSTTPDQRDAVVPHVAYFSSVIGGEKR
jgi:hypothetical protein